MRMADLATNPFDGWFEAQSGLAADHQHVQRIRQPAFDGLEVALVQCPHHVVGQ
jgi:hypothetical protein